jgi:Uma2 family endonuclease
LLVVEISVATLRYDREVKAPLYARHGVPEVWIVDLKADKVHAYSAPRDGVYTVTETAEFGRRSLTSIADVAVDLAPLG